LHFEPSSRNGSCQLPWPPWFVSHEPHCEFIWIEIENRNHHYLLTLQSEVRETQTLAGQPITFRAPGPPWFVSHEPHWNFIWIEIEKRNHHYLLSFKREVRETQTLAVFVGLQIRGS